MRLAKKKSSASKPLAGQTALVAGATRGAGRGIARALAEAGATVYCTGRSTSGKPSPYARPETIEETASLINEAGGRAIALRVDHTVALVGFVLSALIGLFMLWRIIRTPGGL